MADKTYRPGYQFILGDRYRYEPTVNGEIVECSHKSHHKTASAAYKCAQNQAKVLAYLDFLSENKNSR